MIFFRIRAPSSISRAETREMQGLLRSQKFEALETPQAPGRGSTETPLTCWPHRPETGGGAGSNPTPGTGVLELGTFWPKRLTPPREGAMMLTRGVAASRDIPRNNGDSVRPPRLAPGAGNGTPSKGVGNRCYELE